MPDDALPDDALPDEHGGDLDPQDEYPLPFPRLRAWFRRHRVGLRLLGWAPAAVILFLVVLLILMGVWQANVASTVVLIIAALYAMLRTAVLVGTLSGHRVPLPALHRRAAPE